MKIRKYKWLLSLTTIAAVLTPVAIFNGNNNTNGYSIEKQSVKNNAAASTFPSTLTESEVYALAPDPEDLYNEYAFASGYVIKDETSHIIYFYNWFKEEVWQVTLKEIPNFPTETIASMNVKGALTSTGGFDTKLFVYGNFDSNKGSYLFELDMTNGALIANSLVTNTTNINAAETATQNNQDSVTQTTDNSLISDANLLTVIDANTVIVTQKNVQHHSTTKMGDSENTFNFSEIKFSENNESAPTITTYKNVSLGKSTIYTYGEILGVIYSNNQYVFAVNGLGTSNSKYVLSVLEFYFKRSITTATDDSEQENEPANPANPAGTLAVTGFTETKPIATNNTNNSVNDYMYFVNGINPSEVAGKTESTTTTHSVTLEQEIKYLNDKCNNFSVKVAGTISEPKMLISLNWDSTDLSVSNPENPGNSVNQNSNNGANKVLVSSLKSDGTSAPEFATYTLSTSNGIQANLTYMGISNLIYTRDTNQSPFAVAVAYATSGGKTTIWFNFAKIDLTAMETNNSSSSSSSSSNNNDVSYLASGSSESSSNWWFATDDQYSTTTTTSDIQKNKIKMDWYLNFIPNTNKAATDGSQPSYVGYITTGKENSEGSIDYYQNYFEIPGQISNVITINNTKINLNDYQFATIDSLLNNEFKATDKNAATIDSNSFATQSTKTAIINKLASLPSDIVAYNVNVTPATQDSQTDTITTNVLENTSPFANIVLSQDNALTDNLTENKETGIIEGTVSFKVKNYWNDETTTITRNVYLQLNKAADFAFARDTVSKIDDTNADNTAIVDYVEAKYPISTFTKDSDDFKAYFKEFISDSLSKLSYVDLGPTLRDILLNSIDSAVNASVQNQSATKSVSLNSDLQDVNSDSYQVGSYITVWPNEANNSVTITYDLSKTGIPTEGDSTLAPITLTYKNFSTSADPSNFATYDTWVANKQSQDSSVTPQPGNNNNNNAATSSQLEGWKIALIVIAVILVIAIIVGLYFWMKKRNTAKYSN